MNKREKFVKEIAEVINRNSLEGNFNDTPDYILARVAVAAMEVFADASKVRDDWHGFRKSKAKPVKTCKGCPLIDVAPPFKWKSNRNAKGSTKNRKRSTCQKMCKQWRNFSGKYSPVPKL